MRFSAWGHYGYHWHYGGIGDWLAHTVMRGVIYSAINRVFHLMPLPVVIAVAFGIGIVCLAFYLPPRR